MSMQIQINPAGLSQEQREAVCGFILAYPTKSCSNTCHNKQTPDTAATLDKEVMDQLAKEGGEFDASVAFGAKVVGDSEAAAAFGAAVAPLAQGATAAPFTAGVTQLTTAPVVPVDSLTSTTAPTIPAPPQETVVGVPTAPAAPMSHASGVEIDKHGLPWDARIHAGTKRKNADGSWTAKRGIDATLVTAVEAELRQVMGAVAPAAPAAPAAVDGRALFVGLIGRASAAMNAAKLTQEEVAQICGKYGIPALPLLANRLDLVAQVASEIDALIATRQ